MLPLLSREGVIKVKKGLYSNVWENFCVGSIFVLSPHHMIKEKESFKIYITQKGLVSDAGLENSQLYFVC